MISATPPTTEPDSQAVTDLSLADVDPELALVIANEVRRQRQGLEMIASENFAPRAVLEAQGSVLTNKYAEGYPGRRYYGGCEHVDVAENLARDRVKALYGAEHANVQPHSGAQANAAAMHALLTRRGQDPGSGARARRSPDARHEAQLLRQALPRRGLRGGPADLPRRHGRRCARRRSSTDPS